MKERNDQLAQGSHNLWGIAGAQSGAIFAKGHVTHVMERVLNAPMAPRQFQKALGGGQMRGEHDQQIEDLVSGLTCTPHRDRALQFGYVSDVGPGGEIAIHLCADLDAAFLNAPALEIRGVVLLIAGQWISEIGGQIGGEGGVIVFDDQNQIASSPPNQFQQGHVGMQRVGRVEAPCDRQTRQQEIGHRNLIGFVPHPHLEQDFLTVMGTKGQQMGPLLVSLLGAADRLAIQGDRFVWGRLQGSTHPISDGPLDLLGIQARQEPSIE
jgi:hypothetical protein